MGSIPTLAQSADRLVQIPGAMPRLNAVPSGCAFNTRCPMVFQRCRAERPRLVPTGASEVACWLVEEAGAPPPGRSA
jgi:peptide/nickel transport system ATP-binding protein